MSRYHPNADDRRARSAARANIIDAANGALIDPTVKRFTPRRIQQAVCVVRRRQLVSGEVLIAAGFRP